MAECTEINIGACGAYLNGTFCPAWQLATDDGRLRVRLPILAAFCSDQILYEASGRRGLVRLCPLEGVSPPSLKGVGVNGHQIRHLLENLNVPG